MQLFCQASSASIPIQGQCHPAIPQLYSNYVCVRTYVTEQHCIVGCFDAKVFVHCYRMRWCNVGSVFDSKGEAVMTGDQLAIIGYVYGVYVSKLFVSILICGIEEFMLLLLSV